MTEAGHIHFNEAAIHPVISHGGGVYSTRQRTPSFSDRLTPKELDLEDEGVAKSALDDRDIKKKQVS